MPKTTYELPDTTRLQPNDAGRVSGKGSFGRGWLSLQDDPTLADWGITKITIPDPPPPTLTKEKQAARLRLAQYYNDYVSSYFSIGGKTYSAGGKSVNVYQSINAFVREDPATVNYFVIDVNDDPQVVNSEANWNLFWGAYKQLFRDARLATVGVWTQVQAATTKLEVDAAMANLPPIPNNGI